MNLVEGVVKVGRLELHEMPLALILAERNWLHGNPFYRNGKRLISTMSSVCKRLMAEKVSKENSRSHEAAMGRAIRHYCTVHLTKAGT